MDSSSARRLGTIGAHLDASASQPASAHHPPKSQGRVVLIDGESLTPERLQELAHNTNSTIDLTSEAWNKVCFFSYFWFFFCFFFFFFFFFLLFSSVLGP
jgi:hypothetical protein